MKSSTCFATRQHALSSLVKKQQKRSCEEMNPHFFTAPFYFAFIWFRVQGSRGGFAAFFRRWYSRIVTFPSRQCY